MFEPLAKSASHSATGIPETLEQHTLCVVERLVGVAKRSPHLRVVAGQANFWHVAFWAAVMHDFGKAATGFQKRLRGEGERYKHRHEVLSLAFLPWVAEASESKLIALGVISHHRDTEIIEKLYENVSGPELLNEFQPEAIEWLKNWLERVPNTWVDAYALAPFGVHKKTFQIDLTAFSAQAASALERGIKLYATINRVDEPYPDEPEFDTLKRQRRLHLILRGIITSADRMASAGAPIPEALELPSLETLTAQLAAREHKPIQARAHQIAAQRSGNIIFSAPTGSGKTEAALGWAAVQQTTPRRLIYALPYQASLNAMHARLTRDLQLRDGVAILHSRALQVLYRQGLEDTDDIVTLSKNVRRQRDFNQLHQPAVAVLTPYQMLKAMYRLSGYEGVLTMLAGSSLILDEIHAYEPIRLGMFLALMESLYKDYDVRICAMTATMPTWLRQDLEVRLGVSALEVDPQIFIASRRHRLQLLDAAMEDAITLETIVEQVKAGHSILVACNTVKKAQTVWQILKTQLGDQALLLHSRFTGKDRLEKEQRVQGLLDASKDNQQPIAVVATQVIEVSLDLDFDSIISEPAPLEALVQRFGRVNRRGKKGENGIVPVTVLTQPRDGQRIYDDRLIERGLAQLEANDHTELDDQLVSSWLDAVYKDPEVLDAFQGVAQRQAREFQTAVINTLKPFARDEQLEHQFDALFDGIQVLPRSFEPLYMSLLDTSPIEARAYLVNAPRWITGGLKEHVQWSETLKVYVANLPYDAEIGMQWQRPTVVKDAWGIVDD